MAQAIGQLIPPDEPGFIRAGGDVICPVCGLSLYSHPDCADGVLVVGCDGRQYKL
jgi:hypothetical protein